MQTIETYISAQELQQRFRVEQSYKPDFGAFLAIRWLYSITATGGKVWQRLLFFVIFTLTLSPFTLATDIAALAIYAAGIVAKKFIEGLLAAILTVCTKAAGAVAVIVAAVGTTLTIYFKWDAIICFVKGLF